MAATTAAATATTAGFGKVVGSWHTAQFEGHADVFPDFFLDFFELMLCLHEVTCHRAGKQGVAGCLEGFDFSSAQLQSGVLLLVKLFAHFMNVFVLIAGLIIAQKAFDLGLQVSD